MSVSHEFDVIVVGCGGAGPAAALAAQEKGARVCILERASRDESGGNTRYTGAWLRMKSVELVSEDFEAHFAENAGGYPDPTVIAETSLDPESWSAAAKTASFVDPNVVAALADNAPDTLAWASAFGVKYVTLDVPFPTSIQPRISPNGGGLALLEAFVPAFLSKGGTIRYNSAANALCVGDDGSVEGVGGIGPGNRPFKVSAGAVILACGGFEGTPEMLNRYLGRERCICGRCRAAATTTRESIQWHWISVPRRPGILAWHASPMDPRSNRAGPSMYIYRTASW